jgi:hypothetical protein
MTKVRGFELRAPSRLLVRVTSTFLGAKATPFVRVAVTKVRGKATKLDCSAGHATPSEQATAVRQAKQQNSQVQQHAKAG